MGGVNIQTNQQSIQMIFDGMQHCTVAKMPQGKTVSIDCPYTGRGKELSPMNLLGASLAGCIALSMGAMAMQHEMDLRGLKAVVTAKTSTPPRIRLQGFEVHIMMPRNFCDSDRSRLERAADSSPIKQSFNPAIQIVVTYHYPK